LVDPGQIRLDGVHRHEQLARDLFVRLAARDERGHAALRLRQALRPSPAVDSGELATGLRRPQPRSELVEQVTRGLDRLARRALLLEAAQRLALREQRPPELEAAVLHALVLL